MLSFSGDLPSIKNPVGLATYVGFLIYSLSSRDFIDNKLLHFSQAYVKSRVEPKIRLTYLHKYLLTDTKKIKCVM